MRILHGENSELVTQDLCYYDTNFLKETYQPPECN